MLLIIGYEIPKLSDMINKRHLSDKERVVYLEYSSFFFYMMLGMW